MTNSDVPDVGLLQETESKQTRFYGYMNITKINFHLSIFASR